MLPVKQVIKKLISKSGFQLQRVTTNPGTNYSKDRNIFDLYERAQVDCQMVGSDNDFRRQRHYTLNYLLQNTDLGAGDVCEMGCWRGLSSFQIASRMLEKGAKTTFHIFDSFEGLSEYEEIDIPTGNKADLQVRRKQFACSQEIVQSNLRQFSNIKYHKGWIPERFSDVADCEFSFVHIDVDLYQPIRDSILYFYPRLMDKGVMVFDDYGCTAFPGAKKAVDECLAELKDHFFLPLPSGQAFLIKGFKS